VTLDGRLRNQETQRTPTLLTYAGDPNGLLEAAEGTFCWDTVGKVFYVNSDGGTTWTTGTAPPVTSHVLASTSALGPDHTVSGLTARQVLIATGATAALFRALEDADIPAAIARDSELHDAVTLAASLDSNLLSLSTQELGLDTQAANIVFAGPTTGGAAVPSFRSLVEADMPSTMATDAEVTAAIAAHAALADVHHAQSHVLATTIALGPDHTVSGLTARQFLVATGATTALFRAIEDADIPASIARDSELHSAVTLSNDLGNQLLGLTGQEITLDTQAANLVFAGPTSGGLAIPTFRLLVDADIPAAIARDSEVTTAISDHAALPNAHHNQSHVLATTAALGPDHTVSGLTARQVLIATGATTALFRALEDADIPASIARDSETTAAIASHAAIANAHHALVTVSGLGLSLAGQLVTLTSSAAGAANAHILATDASGFVTVQKITTPIVSAAASGSLTLQTITAGAYSVRVTVKTTSTIRHVDFKEEGTDGIQMNFVGTGQIKADDSLYLTPGADLIITTSGAGNDVVINTNQLVVVSSTAKVQFSGNLQSVKSSTAYDVYGFRQLTTPLTSTSWNGDDTKTTGTYTLTPAIFGYPAAAKAVNVLVSGQWAAASAANNCALRSSSGGTNIALIRAQIANFSTEMTVTVPTDASGNFYLVVSGATMNNAVVRVVGYHI